MNNAGIFSTFGPDDWCTMREYELSINVNTMGAIRVCHEFKPLLKQSQVLFIAYARIIEGK